MKQGNARIGGDSQYLKDAHLTVEALSCLFDFRMNVFRFAPVAAAFLLLSGVANGAPVTPPDFNREIRPLLAQYCFKCHGMDDKGRKGGLRLDVRDAALGEGKSKAKA